jgi:hypothetical protein
MSVKIRTNFTFRIDTWTADGESIVEHVAGVEDYQVALATYRAACLRWPGTPHHLAAGCAIADRIAPLSVRISLMRSGSPARQQTR